MSTSVLFADTVLTADTVLYTNFYGIVRITLAKGKEREVTGVSIHKGPTGQPHWED